MVLNTLMLFWVFNYLQRRKNNYLVKMDPLIKHELKNSKEQHFK